MASESIASTPNMWPNYAEPNVNRAASSTKSDSSGTSSLGKDEFLKLLITQLQNQDPMQPMEDKEFIAQMAQFTSVEQLMNISSQLTAMSESLGVSSAMIGKEVSWISEGKTDPITGEKSEGTVQSGIVDSIVIRDGVQYATVGKEEIALTDITSIKNPAGEDSKESIPEEPAGETEAGSSVTP
ncbi:flagellar hook capping protein [Paenibacillus sp. P96]|uniref:Flagellar hook capping protein n=1 Tax=Paenibacillus zeirhizosphaerae TaxID=2987519 RepID=A0ABT9FS94_9BACL|nr:flagellar hook capping FlgD N-terminal domain-containing protein [Paenibacillus sp. P96]MDP4097539.1 flagellar hook capping protein [Paenibacillus sp. P96]